MYLPTRAVPCMPAMPHHYLPTYPTHHYWVQHPCLVCLPPCVGLTLGLQPVACLPGHYAPNHLPIPRDLLCLILYLPFVYAIPACLLLPEPSCLWDYNSHTLALDSSHTRCQPFVAGTVFPPPGFFFCTCHHRLPALCPTFLPFYASLLAAPNPFLPAALPYLVLAFFPIPFGFLQAVLVCGLPHPFLLQTMPSSPSPTLLFLQFLPYPTFFVWIPMPVPATSQDLPSPGPNPCPHLPLFLTASCPVFCQV